MNAFILSVLASEFELNLNSVVHELVSPWLYVTTFFPQEKQSKSFGIKPKTLLIYQITLTKQLFEVKCEGTSNMDIKFPLGHFYTHGKSA